MKIEQQQLLLKAQESLQAAKILEEAKIIINKAEDMLKFSQNNMDLV